MYLLVCMCFIVIEFKRVRCDIINQLYTKCRVKDALCIIIMFVNNFTRILELFNFMKSNIILCWKDNKYAQKKDAQFCNTWLKWINFLIARNNATKRNMFYPEIFSMCSYQYLFTHHFSLSLLCWTLFYPCSPHYLSFSSDNSTHPVFWNVQFLFCCFQWARTLVDVFLCTREENMYKGAFGIEWKESKCFVRYSLELLTLGVKRIVPVFIFNVRCLKFVRISSLFTTSLHVYFRMFNSKQGE